MVAQLDKASRTLQLMQSARDIPVSGKTVERAVGQYEMIDRDALQQRALIPSQ